MGILPDVFNCCRTKSQKKVCAIFIYCVFIWVQIIVLNMASPALYCIGECLCLKDKTIGDWIIGLDREIAIPVRCPNIDNESFDCYCVTCINKPRVEKVHSLVSWVMKEINNAYATSNIKLEYHAIGSYPYGARVFSADEFDFLLINNSMIYNEQQNDLFESQMKTWKSVENLFIENLLVRAIYPHGPAWCWEVEYGDRVINIDMTFAYKDNEQIKLYKPSCPGSSGRTLATLQEAVYQRWEHISPNVMVTYRVLKAFCVAILPQRVQLAQKGQANICFKNLIDPTSIKEILNEYVTAKAIHTSDWEKEVLPQRISKILNIIKERHLPEKQTSVDEFIIERALLNEVIHIFATGVIPKSQCVKSTSYMQPFSNCHGVLKIKGVYRQLDPDQFTDTIVKKSQSSDSIPDFLAFMKNTTQPEYSTCERKFYSKFLHLVREAIWHHLFAGRNRQKRMLHEDQTVTGPLLKKRHQDVFNQPNLELSSMQPNTKPHAKKFRATGQRSADKNQQMICDTSGPSVELEKPLAVVPKKIVKQMKLSEKLLDHLFECLPLTTRQKGKVEQKLKQSHTKAVALLVQYLYKYPDQLKAYASLMDALHHSGQDKLKTDLQGFRVQEHNTMFHQYEEMIKSFQKITMERLNKELNAKLFKTDFRLFHVTLSLAGNIPARSSEKEDYIRRNASSFSSKGKVDIQKLFSQGTESILLYGCAGSGKSTETQKLTHAWAKGEIWKDRFLLVFHLPCRKLRKLIMDKTKISFIAFLEKFHSQDLHRECFHNDLEQIILYRPGEILFIIDGLDELANWDNVFEDKNRHDIHSFVDEHEVLEILYSLINRNFMKDASLLTTTRPIEQINTSWFSQVITVLGFDEDSIDACTFYNSKTIRSQHDQIMDHLEKNPHINSFCAIPLNCVLYCTIALRSMKTGGIVSVDSLTDLSIEVILYILHKDVEQVKDKFGLDESQKSTLLKLSKLAATSLLGETSQLIFDFETLDSHEISVGQNRHFTGFLEIFNDDEEASDWTKASTASFLHLTIQEFLAGLYICLYWNDCYVSIITRIDSKSRRLDNVQLYTAGLLGNEKKGHKLFNTLLNLNAAILKQRRNEFFNKLQSSNKKLSNFAKIQLIQCIHEARTTDAIETVQSSVLGRDGHTLEIGIIVGGFQPQYAAHISYFMQHCSVLTSLSFSGSVLSKEIIIHLADGMKNSKHVISLRLSRCRLPISGMEVLGESCVNLHQLNLDHNRISDAGATALADGIKHCPNLEKIDLGSNRISDAGATALAEGIKQCPNLKEINLGSNRISDAGATALAEGIQHCSNLMHIHLSCNPISDAGAIALAEGIQHCPNLETINLQQNVISDAGATALAEGIINCPHLERIILSCNPISDAGATALADVIKHCPNLEKMDLQFNKISDAGATALADGIKHCPNLERIYLWGNNMTQEKESELQKRIQISC